MLDGLNRYAYCWNNPIMYVDPTGHGSTPVINNAGDVAKLVKDTQTKKEIKTNSGSGMNVGEGSGDSPSDDKKNTGSNFSNNYGLTTA